ncbi:MAG: carboxylesterase [Methylococcaceae bacterium]|nr:carboxylesterase [Methylococcaceae bacterium]
MTPELTTVEIAPRSTHHYSIIWLHGLGADGHDFESIVPELRLPQQAATRFIFPNAPIQAVTVNGGQAMRSWYDILDRSLHHKVDVAGIYQSSAQVAQLIDGEIADGIAPANILLAGFSQGGVIALHTGLRYPQRLAGIIALSTYLPTLEQLTMEAAPANQDLPIFMAHGTVDPVVAIQAAKEDYAGLLARHYSVQWQEYPIQHSVCAAEIAHIAAFINSVFH